MPSPPPPSARAERWFWPLLGLGVAALTARAFGHGLAHGFTDCDALADVAWASRPLRDQLLAPLTGGLAQGNAPFWRPAFMLEAWLLFRISGWSSVGWQLWALALHTVNALLAALFVLRSTEFAGQRDRPLAALTALLFAGHPLAVEVVLAVARSIDLLLAAGSFLTLIALVAEQTARRNGSRALGCTALPFALALGSKEPALVLLPVVALWIALFREDLAGRARAKEAAITLAPLLAISVAFMAVRASVLRGEGGYGLVGDRASAIGAALVQGAIEPFAASLSPQLRALPLGLVVLAAIVAWILIARAIRSSGQARLAIVLGAQWALLCVAYGATFAMGRRLYYAPTIFFALVPALLALQAWRARSVIAGALAALLLAAWLHGSPALQRYHGWDEAWAADALWLRPELYAALPDGTTIYVVDQPFQLDVEPRREMLAFPETLNHTNLDYGAQAWLDARFPGRGLRFVRLSEVMLSNRLACDAPTLAPRADGVHVARTVKQRRFDAEVTGVHIVADAVAIDVSISPAAAAHARLWVWTGAGMIDVPLLHG